MRFEDACTGWQERRLTQEAAAELLGVCDRTFRRHIKHFENEGMDGLLDKRMHQVSALCAPVDEVMALEALYREVRQLDRCPLPRALHGGTQGRAQLLAWNNLVTPLIFSGRIATAFIPDTGSVRHTHGFPARQRSESAARTPG